MIDIGNIIYAILEGVAKGMVMLMSAFWEVVKAYPVPAILILVVFLGAILVRFASYGLNNG